MSMRSFSPLASVLRAVLLLAVLVLAGCTASTRPLAATPTRVDVLATGFLVDNTVLATTEELRAFLRDTGARDVKLHAAKDIASDRISRAATAIRDSGASVEIVVAAPELGPGPTAAPVR